jgi:hypothetical protein
MERTASVYQGVMKDPSHEESEELEREELASSIVSEWQTEHPGETGLNEVAPLVSTIKQTLDTARVHHNERYVFALARAFVNQTDKLQLSPEARRALDKPLTEALESFQVSP